MAENEERREKIRPQRARMGLPARLAFSALFFGGAAYFVSQTDYVLAAFLAATGIAAFGGYRAGAVRIFGTLIAFTAAILVAPSIGMGNEERFAGWFGTTGLTNRVLAIGAVGILISMIVSMITFLVAGMFLAKRPKLDSANRWLGFGIGAAEGMIGILLLLGGLLIIEPTLRDRMAKLNAADAQRARVANWVLAVNDNVHSSRVGHLVEQYNPFKLVPQLNKLEEIQQSVTVLSDPQKIDELIQHPSIKDLQKRPEVKQAVRSLMQDPEIKEILSSGKRIDRDSAMKFLNHPAVLELIDQPGFTEEAYRIIQESGAMPFAPTR